MGCLKLSYYQTESCLPEASPLRISYVNGEVREEKEYGFLGVVNQQTNGNEPNHEWQHWQNLTPDEKAILFRAPSIGQMLISNHDLAFKKTRELFPNPGTGHNDNADAFRHAFFNALNARYFGAKLANELGMAHENWPGNPQIEMRMDMNNNKFGHATAIANPNASIDQIATLIYMSVKTGQLLRINNGSLGPTGF